MIDLSKYKRTYRPAKSLLVRAAWQFAGLPLLSSHIIPSSALRVWVLRLFGAQLGTGVVIKPGVRVKYPWLLRAGNHCWIGEDCWIDNLGMVALGDNVCLSQGAYLCTGSHDWTDPQFGLIVKPIDVLDCAWICAKAMVGPGVLVGAGAIVAAGAIATRSIPAWEIHTGNPARFVRKRVLSQSPEPAAVPEYSHQ